MRIKWQKHRTGFKREDSVAWFARVDDREVMIRKTWREGTARRNGKPRLIDFRFEVYRREGLSGNFVAAPYSERSFGGLSFAKPYGERWLLKQENFAYGPDELADLRSQ